MSILKKKKPKKDCPSKKFNRAEEIAKQYDQLSKCCAVLSELAPPKDADSSFRLGMMHSGGWRLWEHTVSGAGIDIEEVYAHIGRLANKRKAELECELAKLDA